MTSVAFLVDQLFSPVPGGMGTYVRELLPALAREDPSLEVTLVHAAFEGPPPSDPWLKAYRTVAIPRSIRRLYPSWALIRRPTLPAQAASTDLVHSPLPAAVPPTGERQRLVVTVHDLAFITHGELFPPVWRAMYRAGLARAVRSADAVIAVSRHTAEDLVRHTRIDSARIHVIPLAASLPDHAGPVDRTLARLKVPRPYVLFVGTLEPRKNLVRLVRAFRRVAARGAPHALVLAGPAGWGHQPLMRELEREGAGEVVLTGAVPPGDLDALYRGADAFVYPSLYEGFGLPVVEAMARGTPTIVSTSSSLPEVAGDAALFVDARSVAGLAEAIERVLTDRGVADRLRAAGPARAARYSWSETARGTLGVYKTLE